MRREDAFPCTPDLSTSGPQMSANLRGSAHASSSLTAHDQRNGTSSGAATAAAATATATAAAAQPPDAQVEQPCIGWDLTIHPRPLNDAYWRERASKHSQWDFQVVLFLSVTLLALTLRFHQQMGVTRVTLSFGVAWLMCLSWGVALYSPSYYLAHRVPIVLVGRVLMALGAYLATNGVREQLYKTLMFPSAKLSLFFKMFLFCNTGQMPVESVRLQLPLVWQMIGTAGKAVALFLSEFTSEFVAFCDSPRYLTALSEMNGAWATIVQSGSPLPLPSSSSLAGRSSGAVMAVTTVWMTVVLLIGYLCYMSLWSDMRVWLASKGRTAQQQGYASTEIGGVLVTVEQLRHMCQSPFALLLQAKGVAGTFAKILMHLGLVNILCTSAWLLSHLLVQQLLPVLLPEPLMGVYYSSLQPDAAAGAAVATAQP